MPLLPFRSARAATFFGRMIRTEDELLSLLDAGAGDFLPLRSSQLGFVAFLFILARRKRFRRRLWTTFLAALSFALRRMIRAEEELLTMLDAGAGDFLPLRSSQLGFVAFLFILARRKRFRRRLWTTAFLCRRRILLAKRAGRQNQRHCRNTQHCSFPIHSDHLERKNKELFVKYEQNCRKGQAENNTALLLFQEQGGQYSPVHKNRSARFWSVTGQCSAGVGVPLVLKVIVLSAISTTGSSGTSVKP